MLVRNCPGTLLKFIAALTFFRVRLPSPLGNHLEPRVSTYSLACEACLRWLARRSATALVMWVRPYPRPADFVTGWIVMSQGSQSWRSVGDEQSPADACKKSLLSVIELQIVPQLVRAHRDQLPSGSGSAGPYIPPSADVVAEFAQLCHLEDEKACWEMVDRLMHDRRGAPEILLKLIAPAARYLGELWNQDRLNFSQVTLGLLRMQNMTHHYSSLSRRSSHREGPKFRAMVAAAPGSQHLLGLTMVSEFFVNDGWDVHVEVATTEKKLLGAVQANWFEVLGLSVGLLQQLDTLPALVKALRRHSLNPRIGVLLGGVAFTQVGSAGECYGADAVCLDPLAAMRVARQLAMRSLGPDTGKS